LGFGFRCGSSDCCILEIIQERLEREFHIDLITTAPGGALPEWTTIDERTFEVDNPTKFRIRRISTSKADHRCDVITREEFIGEILKLLERNGNAGRSSSTSAPAACCWCMSLR